MSETALAVVSNEERPSASALMRVATDVAGVCREIVTRTAMELQGKKYVRVEGWQSIAAVYGCSPSIREVVETEDGSVRAVAELRRADGTVVASAEGYCGVDEPRWATQAVYARRGMAQTRAVSRVCRSVFAFVVTLIDSSLSTTPAEEIPAAGEVVSVQAARVVAARSAVAHNEPSHGEPISGGPGERTARTRVRYGKSKGKYLCDIEDADLDWQLAAATKSVEANDPKWHASNCAWLDAVREEVARRGK